MNLHLDNHTQSTLQNAGFCADFAASRGLISPTTLLVASHLERLLQNLHMLEEWIRADFKAKASGYKALWAALERRNQALAERDRKRAAKVGRAPNAYACARNGCPIKATSKMALRRCTGPCPEEVKPAYCGVECQRLVRAYFSTAYCVPSGLVSDIVISTRTGRLIRNTANLTKDRRRLHSSFGHPKKRTTMKTPTRAVKQRRIGRRK